MPNGKTIFDVEDTDLTYGRVGLYCAGKSGACFHFVKVTPVADSLATIFEDLFEDTMVTRPAHGWPVCPVHFLDRRLQDGWYTYRVKGMDIFGRVSEFCLPELIQVMDIDAPPPPVIVAAKTLQFKPDGVQENVIDRTLSQMEKNWLTQHIGTGGIRIQWTWTSQMHLSAPDAAEFRIYYHPGQANTIGGRITKVQHQDATSVITTDQTTDLPTNAFVNEKVRVGLQIFEVKESTTGKNFTLTVNNISNPEHEFNPKAPQWLKPEPTPFGVTVGSGSPNFLDFLDAKNWKTRLHVVPIPPTPTGHIVAIEDEPDGKRILITSEQWKIPTSIDGLTIEAKPGILICDGLRYKVLEHIAGSKMALRVEPIFVHGEYRPIPNSSFGYYPRYDYDLFLPGVPLNPSSADPMVYGQIGISTADNETHQFAVDDPARSGTPWGDRPGNESPVSASQTIFAVFREKPLPPKEPPPAIKRIFADLPDYYGHSHYTIRWERVPIDLKDPANQDGGKLKFNDKHLRYEVYRAVDSSLFATDKANWPGRPFNVQPPYFSEVSEYWPYVRDDLNALQKANPGYAGLNMDYVSLSLQVLASLPGNTAAFTLITPNGIDPEDPANQDGGKLKFTDTLPGNATNCYFYRVATVDKAGNRSDLGVSTPPIYLPDTACPQVPKPVKILGGNRKVTLKWQLNREPGMERYLIYRTTDQDQAEDIRLMGNPVAEVAYPNTEYTDKNLVGPLTYFYRIIAVREGETKHAEYVQLKSIPTPVLTARAYDESPPEPPIWVRAEWVLVDADENEYPFTSPFPDTYIPAVVLEWGSKYPYVQWILQRRLGNTEIWRNVSSWLVASDGHGYMVDHRASTENEYVYRVRGEDLLGRTHVFSNERVVKTP